MRGFITGFLSAVAPGIQVPLSVTDNSQGPPFLWTVVQNQSGATLSFPDDLTTASVVYKAGPNYGRDMVSVTNTAGFVVSTYSISVLDTINLVCDIIRTAMGLDSSQVYLWDQKLNVPIDERIYIAVGIQSTKVFGNNILENNESVNIQQTLSIDVLGRLGVDGTNGVITQKDFVVMALNSQYSQSQQEANNFYIAPVTSKFLNLSRIDGDAIPYRFRLSVNVQYHGFANTISDYFDSFSDLVTTGY
jgi:hypothetical protein